MTKCQQFFVKASKKYIIKSQREKLISFNEEIHYSIPILTWENVYYFSHVCYSWQKENFIEIFPSYKTEK